MEQAAAAAAKLHTLRLEGRRAFLAEGVAEVLSYDETSVVAEGDFGRLVLQGKGMHILSFERASGRLSGEGELESIHYLAGEAERKGGWLSRMLR